MDFKLNLKKKQKEELEICHAKATSQGDRKTIQRMNALLGLADGYRPCDIAKILRVSAETVRQWVRQFLSNGLESLKPGLKSGRPPKLTKTQKKNYMTSWQQGLSTVDSLDAAGGRP